VTKSKAWVRNYKRREVYPVLAFGGIPHHILALHEKRPFVEENGTFIEEKVMFVEVRREQVRITQSLINAEMTTQGDFARMRALLENLRQMVIARGAANPLSLLCLDGKLQVFERLDGATLPADFIAQFT
jgi:predicted RNA-binding protein